MCVHVHVYLCVHCACMLVCVCMCVVYVCGLKIDLQCAVCIDALIICSTTLHHRVSHPNIVKLYELYDDKTRLYLVIEL